MRKITFFMLMAVGLLISGNAGAAPKKPVAPIVEQPTYQVVEVNALPSVVNEKAEPVKVEASEIAQEPIQILNLEDRLPIEEQTTVSKSPRRAAQGDAANVAMVVETSTEYATIEEAIAAAEEGQTVKLLSPITQSTAVTIDKAITLDLNGYTFTNDGTQYLIAIKTDPGAGKTVTIDGYNDDLTQTGTITNAGTVSPTKNIWRALHVISGSIIINGCNLSSASYVLYNNGESLSISNSTISGGRFAFVNIAASNITIGENVSMTGYQTYSLLSQAEGTSSILMSSPLTDVCTDGSTTTFTINSGLSVSTSTWALSGATTFNNNGTLEIATACGSYAMNINNTGTCSITAGSFKKNVAIDNTGTLTISGGEFSADLTLGASQSCIVTGGTFAVGTEDAPLAYDRIAGFIQSGYKAVSSVIGSTPAMAVVEDSYVGEATYNNTDYATLSAAVAAALANTEDLNPVVTLAKDVTLSSTLTISKTLTLDISTFNINGTGSYGYIAISGGDVTIQGSGSINSESSKGTIYTSSKTANLDLKGTVQISGKYGIHDYSGIKNLTIASSVSITGETNDIYIEDYCENVVNHSNADIVYTSSYVYIGDITNDGGGTVLIKSGCKISASSYDKLKGYIETGYKGFLQKDATYGDIYLVAAETQTVAAKIGNYEYLTLSAANSAAVAGDEIDLVADFSTSSSFTISKQITIDLNGFNWTTTSKQGVAISNNIVIKNSKTTGQFNGNGEQAGFWLNANATLTFEDIKVVFTGKSYAGFMFYGANSTLNTNNSIIDITGNGFVGFWDYSKSAKINLNNSTITSTYGVFDMTGGTLTCTNTDITCTETNNIQTYVVQLEDGSSLIYNSGNMVVSNPTSEFSSGVNILGDACSVTINGGSITAETYTIVGNGSQTTNSVININGGTLTATDGHAIYHPQSGTLTITDGVLTGTLTAIEMRGGNLNISGGTFISTYEGFSCTRNGSGTTTAGAALAIAQHTTKLPINVTISGGHFKGNYPISQCNPQENEAEYVALLDIEVTGGYFWADNGTSIVSHTEDRRLFLKGGVYNLDPAAFTVNGFFSGNNQPELYAGSYAQGYVYKVYQQEIKENETNGTETTDWAQTTTWNTDLVPDYATNVTIGKNIEVTTSAEANTITINTGSTLTVKEGGTLIIGNGGIIGATNETFKVEAGGQVLIAPNAENANLRGSVELLADRAGLKPSETEYTGQGSQMYWQHIAIPINGAPESITPSVLGKTFFNTWDIVKGWENVGTAVLNTPFKGYNLGNYHPYSADGSQSITYTFVGQLVGNQPDYMVFAREGHSFFGNSYLAPLDVATLFGTLYNSELEYTLNIYDSQTEIYQPVNKATYAILGIDEIKPLQGFFIYAQNATQAQLDYNSAVFTAYLNKHAVGGQPSTLAPAHKAAKTNMYDKMAQITVAATTGEKDAIYLFEETNFSDAEDNGFDARNLEHSGLDMSIVGSYADLSVLATDNLENASLNINTNNAVEYTMTFSHVQGDMTLTDNMTGAVITMQEGATYTFAAQPNVQLNGRFTINAVGKVPTNMDKVKAASAAKGIYTIMGQYVGEATNWYALPAGIYIVDGVRVCK